MYKFIGEILNPGSFFSNYQIRFDHNGLELIGFDDKGDKWQVSFPGHVTHRYSAESFTVALDEHRKDLSFSHVYEWTNSDYLASLAAAGADTTGLRHFTYANSEDYIEVIATHPPEIRRVT